MPKATLPDAEVFYDTAGDDGTPVLLIMGFGVPGRMWKYQIPALSARHRVAWFDNAGAGETRSKKSTPYTMRTMASHVAGLLDALRWDEAHIVGVSMGGMVAQELALRHTDRVRSLSLLVTHAGGVRSMLPHPKALSLFARSFLGPKGDRARAIERMVFPPEYLATLDRDRIQRALQNDVAEAATLRDRLGQIAAVMTHNAARRLPSLRDVPTLVVKAGKDVLLRPSESDRLHRLIPGSRLVEIPDAGHAVLMQCADRLNDELLAHFRGVDEILDSRGGSAASSGRSG
jgi:pimeloyl-ACP methyl ester carboxylesterase